MTRLLFIVLLCSLVVPRAAWGEHLAGHDQLSVSGAVHTHHGNHAHEHDVQDSAEHDGTLDGENGNDGLTTHDHSTAFAVGSAVVLPDSVTLLPWPLTAEAEVAREPDGKRLRHPDSLLRPPRTA
jgi:hypothetical protein